MTTSRPTPPPVFAITIVPFAAAVGYLSIAAPYWLAVRGVSVAAIGAVSGVALAPHGLKMLWAPILDVGARRRAWFATMTLATAAGLAWLAVLPAPEQHLGLFTAVALAANVAATTSCAAADGLMALTTAPDRKGSAAAWRMAGNVGGTGVLGALLLWLAKRSSVAAAGMALAALTAATALAALVIHEPYASPAPRERDERAAPRDAGPGAVSLALSGLAAVLRDAWRTLRSREGWTAAVICAVPVGAGALTNLFSSLAPEYHASDDLVAVVNGLWGGVVGAAGSFAGGWLADRMNRRLAYAASGALIAACALAMMAAPMTPLTFAWGTLSYNFATGVAFAALAAFVLELEGGGIAAATNFTLFISIANLAGSYVTALDGWASEFRGLGARATLAADAALTVAGIAVLGVMVRVARRPAPTRGHAPAG
jgi:hypothetical protein